MGVSSTIDVHTGDGSPETFKPTLIGSILNSNSPPDPATFARFLDDKCKDILRFASIGTTEQESGTRFRVDHLKPSGAIGFYCPDWVAVQRTDGGEVNWIIGTKGRVWEDTLVKDAAISDWCKKVSDQTGTRWRYLRVNQAKFGDGQFASLRDLLAAIEGGQRLPLLPSS